MEETKFSFNLEEDDKQMHTDVQIGRTRLRSCVSEITPLKKNKSKYKGKNLYNSTQARPSSCDRLKQDKLSERTLQIEKMKNSIAVSNFIDSPKVIREITDDKDSAYFGVLEGDDQQYEKFIKRGIGAIDDDRQEDFDDSSFVRRSKRKVAKQSFAEFNENGVTLNDNQDDDEYRLIKCSQFDNTHELQPIKVYLSFQSFLFMNIHAHLFSNEVIGFNAGNVFEHQSGQKAVFVEDVYPVNPIEDTTADRSKSVEMDPESSELNRKLAESRGQTIVGWYHSHPVFDTNPSRIDISNQQLYQTIFTNDGNKPFVAFIVGPYSPKLNSWKVVSEFRCFFVVEEDTETTHPYELEYQVVPQK